MKYLAVCAFALGPTAAFSAGLVSAYDFSGSLDPFVNTGHAGTLLHLSGGANPSATGSTYATATVGATTKQVLNFTAPDTLFALHGIGINGGGDAVNQFTILMDVRFDAQPSGAYASLFNTNATNSNDGDSFLKWGSGNAAAIGISGDYAGSVSASDWHRLAITVDDSSTGLITYFMDGAQIQQHSIGVSVDGRWSMYSYNDSDPANDGVFILGDEDGDNGSGQISQLAFYDHALSLSEFQALGRVGQPVPEPASLAALGAGFVVALRRRRRG